MRFSIVTPSFRSSRWLRLCIASVADQGVEVEHIVQDACSDDGTGEWLPGDSRVRAFVEPDQGMYDAINRGLRRSSGELLAYLNCDEQYLPGALASVDRYFAEHANIDVVFGDGIIVGPTGNYLCHRPALHPRKWHTLVAGSLAILSCATFFRRRLLDDMNLFFDTRYRALGDAQWILDMLERRVAMGLLRELTSAFSITGENLSAEAVTQRERASLLASAPAGVRALRAGIVAHHRLRKLLAGHYTTPPFDYAIHTLDNPARRMDFHVAKPTGIWRPNVR